MDRSIPAWAGEPDIAIGLLTLIEVYPRVGGGTQFQDRWLEGARGLSPRGRGNPGVAGVAATLGGSIPAWAGEPITKPSQVNAY